MLNQLNINIFTAINNLAGHNSLADNLAIALAEYLPYFFILVLLYLWFKKHPEKHQDRNIILYAGYATILGLAINRLITLIYFHPRPFMDHLGTTLIEHVAESSFPSDHTTFMLAIALTFLYFSKTRNAGIILLALGIIGGLARVYSGIHYPFDVLGSLFVAGFSSCLIFYTKQKFAGLNSFLLTFYQKISFLKK